MYFSRSFLVSLSRALLLLASLLVCAKVPAADPIQPQWIFYYDNDSAPTYWQFCDGTLEYWGGTLTGVCPGPGSVSGAAHQWLAVVATTGCGIGAQLSLRQGSARNFTNPTATANHIIAEAIISSTDPACVGRNGEVWSSTQYTVYGTQCLPDNPVSSGGRCSCPGDNSSGQCIPPATPCELADAQMIEWHPEIPESTTPSAYCAEHGCTLTTLLCDFAGDIPDEPDRGCGYEPHVWEYLPPPGQSWVKRFNKTGDTCTASETGDGSGNDDGAGDGEGDGEGGGDEGDGDGTGEGGETGGEGGDGGDGSGGSGGGDGGGSGDGTGGGSGDGGGGGSGGGDGGGVGGGSGGTDGGDGEGDGEGDGSGGGGGGGSNCYTIDGVIYCDGDGPGGGDGECDPETEECGEGEGDSYSGDGFYTPAYPDGIEGLVDDFAGQIGESSVIGTVNGMFSVDFGGSCPVWELPIPMLGQTYVIDIQCDSQFDWVWQLLAALVLATATLQAIRTALDN